MNEVNDDIKNKYFDEISEGKSSLDDICSQIFFTLIAYKQLRRNELLRTLKKHGLKISSPTLKEHLYHLIEKNLIEREEKGIQNVTYGLVKEIKDFMTPSQEEIREWYDEIHYDSELPKIFQSLKITQKEIYSKFSDEQIDKKTSDDLADTLSLNLHELKTFIGYDLELGRFDSDKAFWTFVGNPLYRMHEKRVVEKCRASKRYKKLLFEKIRILVEELRSDKKLFRERKKLGIQKAKRGGPSVPPKPSEPTEA